MDAYSDETALIRKQREEIILLTNELQRQETELNALNDNNLKLKQTIKSHDEKFRQSEHQIKLYEREIKELKSQIDQKEQEIEANKQKFSQKENFHAKQSIKFQQSQFTIEKLGQEIASLQSAVKELKSENAKLQIKVTEQASRYKDARTKQDELAMKLETKTSLLDVAKGQIFSLETSLRNFVKFYQIKKKLTENILSEKAALRQQNVNESPKSGKDEKSLISVSMNADSLQSENDHIYFINLASEILVTNQDSRLNYLHMTLREHWFESNVICEEMKGLLTAKYKEAIVQFNNHNFKCETKEEKKLERNTSTPVNF